MGKGTVLFNGKEVHVDSFIEGMNAIIDSDLSDMMDFLVKNKGSNAQITMLSVITSALKEFRTSRSKTMREKMS